MYLVFEIQYVVFAYSTFHLFLAHFKSLGSHTWLEAAVTALDRHRDSEGALVPYQSVAIFNIMKRDCFQSVQAARPNTTDWEP